MDDKLYYQDAYLQSFEAEIVKRGAEENGQPYVVLTQTAFYPTGGGQPCDLGTLGNRQVTDVEEVAGEIRHRLDAPIAEDVTKVAGQIDWERRFDLMQQHAGQHILSASFIEIAGAQTVAFHLGREHVTIDVELDTLAAELAERVERLANQIVMENRPIEARFVTEEELAQLPLTKQPTVTENIRVVMIKDFDYNPCGGTHPHTTGEVGPIKIIGWERHRGNIRVQFVCGARAFADYSRKQKLLQDLMRLLGTSESEACEVLGRLLTEKEALKEALQQKEMELLSLEAERLRKESEGLGGNLRLVLTSFAGRSMQELQQLARAITSQDAKAIVLFATTGEKLQLVFARGTDVTVEMNQLVKETLPLIDGKGGGSPSMAQGGGAATLPVDDLLSHARGLLLAKIEG
ncbi:DHHA1 domain-containing protein [Brevibacillus ruminantium]|uniref:DHHA1 domain-containing protein n=2 Tax=Brevibacillus ruminantium TaxID=2950604 RepID=A0ABY4WNT0_9BACL|nr:DHHA1 domain-containing protein [Brevibacillus ruminantium]